MTQHTKVFTPDVQPLGQVPATYTVAEVAQEVGMFSATPEFVLRHGGEITRSILHSVPDTFYSRCLDLGLLPNIDVRVHRLYPGDIPAVPGWHADGEYRPSWHAQPQLEHLPNHEHLLVSVSTEEDGVSLTEVVDEPFEATWDDQGVLWNQVHKQVEDQGPHTRSLPDGVLTSISSETLHRATPARVRGWRLLVRVSMWHKPGLGKDNQGMLARQEYVYRTSENGEW